jgi:hypothetical protein
VNRRIAYLLADYLRRTLGLWVLLVLAQLLQTSVFWAARTDRLPLLGVVMASLLYFAAFESPQTVLRTLPLSSTDVALFRWWASIGAPGLIILTCTVVSAITNSQHGWPVPTLSAILDTAGLLWSALGWLAVLPLPELNHNERRGSWFALVWGALITVAVYGAPTTWLPPEVRMLLTVSGIVLSTIAFARAARGQSTKLSLAWAGAGSPKSAVLARRGAGSAQTALPVDAGFASHGRRTWTGWPMLVLEVARSTAWLSIVALIATAMVRISVTPWFYSAFEPALVWMFASAVAVAACVLTRRWMLTVRSLRMLPIGDHRLALLLYLILITPGLVGCLVVMGARQLSQSWGLDVPAYMLVVFLVSPAALVPWQQQQRASSSAAATAIQQWSPLIQQAAFPLWAGALCAFGGPRLQPAWFVGFLVLFGAAACVAGYVALLVGIRSPHGLGAYGEYLHAPS